MSDIFDLIKKSKTPSVFMEQFVKDAGLLKNVGTFSKIINQKVSNSELSDEELSDIFDLIKKSKTPSIFTEEFLKNKDLQKNIEAFSNIINKR